MNRSIQSEVEHKLGVGIVDSTSVGGGCISSAFRIKTATGTNYFLKYGANEPEIYLKEANGLKELTRAGTLRVPEIIHTTENYLLLEYMEQGLKGPDFFRKFGRAYAKLHRFTGEHFGFYEDNYLGSAIQQNVVVGTESCDWNTFYWNKRLLFQLNWAEKQQLASEVLIKSFAKLEERFTEIMQNSENIPVLLHGDLWGGNYMVGEDGEAVLIDPAVYYGNREADLAMTKLFGGFDNTFYETYQSEYPLPEGYTYREPIYKLYHILNHLNLFGKSYLGQAERLIDYYL